MLSSSCWLNALAALGPTTVVTNAMLVLAKKATEEQEEMNPIIKFWSLAVDFPMSTAAKVSN